MSEYAHDHGKRHAARGQKTSARVAEMMHADDGHLCSNTGRMRPHGTRRPHRTPGARITDYWRPRHYGASESTDFYTIEGQNCYGKD